MPLQVIAYGLIQTDFMNPINRKNIQYKVLLFLQFSIQKLSPFFFFVCREKVIPNCMASVRADDDPQASEYAGKIPPMIVIMMRVFV